MQSVNIKIKGLSRSNKLEKRRQSMQVDGRSFIREALKEEWKRELQQTKFKQMKNQ